MRLWTTGDRVAALQSYEILDTPPEAAFEDIVEIARALTGAPIAMVSFLDSDRQWFKAERGAGLRETPLDTSFCALAADADVDVLLIPDATADPRTASMVVVTEGPRVRSYAGVLLRSAQGAPIGTVCVLDLVPRDFASRAVDSLKALARQVTAHLELRRVARERAEAVATLKDASQGRELALQAANLGRWDHRPHTGERFYDVRAREILGLADAGDISVARALEGIHPEDRAAIEPRLREAVTPDRVGPFEAEFRVVDGPGVRWVSAVGRSLFEDGVCTRFFGVLEDVTERRRLEEHRTFLTAELNHRVKNILALAQSVVDATLRSATDLKDARRTIGGRLQALSRAHDLLLTQHWEAASIRQVAEATLRAAGVADDRIELSGPAEELGSRAALQFALALHELATNAGKYGALSNDTGRVALSWSLAGYDGAQQLTISWVERGGPPVSEPGQGGFGSRVIGRATEAAFEGVVDLVYAPAGLRWSVTAPVAGLGARAPG